MRRLVGRDRVGTLERLHAQVRDHRLDGLRERLDRRQLVRLGYLVRLAQVVPGLLEVVELVRHHVVGEGELGGLKRVLVRVALGVGLAGLRVAVLHDKLERVGERALRVLLGRFPQDDVGRLLVVVRELRNRRVRLLLQVLGVGLGLHVHALEDLVVERVAAVKLQHYVLREDVLDQHHGVLGLAFGQLDRLGRHEQHAQMRQLGHLGQRGRVGFECALVALPERRRGCHRRGHGLLGDRLLLAHDRRDLRLRRDARDRARVKRRRDGVGRLGAVRGKGALERGDRVDRVGRDKLPGHGHVLLDHVEEERGAVAHLVVVVVKAPVQQHHDLLAHRLEVHGKLGERRHGGGADGRGLEDDAVVDVAHDARRVLRGRALTAEHVQDAHGQLRKLAVLDVLAQLHDRRLLRVRQLGDERHERVDNCALELEATLLAQVAGQEREDHVLLARELDAQRADGLDHDDLELVCDLGHEALDLLHQAVDRGLAARLEQGGDGQS
eukprot:Unigene4981_Nuclearia_a/m.15262 Unigene4981_Nuclearia_a/g.15262  ORF Unigene4981_Nuclearia_a/g.15262 Unigene4981_Nuclearia_a/m.15262 type:complete len:497 (-) Unigene4981_Nuclearia_a:1004-2494(-)